MHRGMLLLWTAGLLQACGGGQDTTVAALPPVIAEGQQIYQANCKVCHAQGISGAPILGNQKMWAGRADKGLDALVASAINGTGLMPAKGGNDELREEDIAKAVGYLLFRLN